MSTRALERRITDLEARAMELRPKKAPSQGHDGELTPSHWLWRWMFGWPSYDTWRHDGLSLEARLSLARDDAARAETKYEATWAPALTEVEAGRWVDRRPAREGRMLEIAILERDGRIDEAVANTLRDNARDHFKPGERTVVRPALAELPVVVEIDAKTAAEARRRCPRREDLPIDKQLAMVREDYRHAIEGSIDRNSGPGAVPPPRGWSEAWVRATPYYESIAGLTAMCSSTI